MAELEFELGRIHWGGMRDIVRELKWRGRDVDMFEGSGFLSRRFVIRGDRAALEYIKSIIEDYERDLAARRG